MSDALKVQRISNVVVWTYSEPARLARRVIRPVELAPCTTLPQQDWGFDVVRTSKTLVKFDFQHDQPTTAVVHELQMSGSIAIKRCWSDRRSTGAKQQNLTGLRSPVGVQPHSQTITSAELSDRRPSPVGPAQLSLPACRTKYSSIRPSVLPHADARRTGGVRESCSLHLRLDARHTAALRHGTATVLERAAVMVDELNYRRGPLVNQICPARSPKNFGRLRLPHRSSQVVGVGQVTVGLVQPRADVASPGGDGHARSRYVSAPMAKSRYCRL